MSASRMEVVLLANGTATGDWKEWPGGEGRFDVCGTVTSGNVTLQVKGCDGETGHTVGSSTTLTSTGTGGFKLEAGCEIRVHISGTVAALNVKAYRNP